MDCTILYTPRLLPSAPHSLPIKMPNFKALNPHRQREGMMCVLGMRPPECFPLSGPWHDVPSLPTGGCKGLAHLPPGASP